MPSFATDVKNALARLSYDRECCRIAELCSAWAPQSLWDSGARKDRCTA